MEKASELLRQKLNYDFPPILDQVKITIVPWCEGVRASKSLEVGGITVDMVEATFRIGVTADYYYYGANPPRKTYVESGVVVVRATPSGSKTKHGKEKPEIKLLPNGKELMKRIRKPKVKFLLFNACRTAFFKAQKAYTAREPRRTKRRLVELSPVDAVMYKVTRREGDIYREILRLDFFPRANVFAVPTNEAFRKFLFGTGMGIVVACEATLAEAWQNFLQRPPRERKQTRVQRKMEGKQLRLFEPGDVVPIETPRQKAISSQEREITSELPAGAPVS
jgi:hypothetical protein